MKRQHRPIRGLLLLALAVFFAAGPYCGAAGKLVHVITTRFIGPGGLVILCGTLLAMAAVCLTPPGAVAAWLARVREERRELRRDARRRTRQAVVHAPPVVEAGESPQARQQRDRVRAAMKALGFKTYEFETFVQGMDPTQPVELLVREGLRKMQQQKAVS